MRNLYLSIKIIDQKKTTTDHLNRVGRSRSFDLLCKVHGNKSESLTIIRDLSLTGKLVHPIVDEHFVQWEKLAEKY